MSPIILVGAGILLLGLGMGLGYFFANSQRKRETTRASDIQNELDDYRRHVTEHFDETAQHFQTLGQHYQSLYKHMEQGADALCDPAQSDALLGFVASSAPLIAASSTVEAEKQPEVIKDYATENEIEPPQVERENEAVDAPEPLENSSVVDAEAEFEAANTSEPLERSSDGDDVTAEPPAEEVISDQVGQPTPIEPERMVH